MPRDNHSQPNAAPELTITLGPGHLADPLRVVAGRVLVTAVPLLVWAMVAWLLEPSKLFQYEIQRWSFAVVSLAITWRVSRAAWVPATFAIGLGFGAILALGVGLVLMVTDPTVRDGQWPTLIYAGLVSGHVIWAMLQFRRGIRDTMLCRALSFAPEGRNVIAGDCSGNIVVYDGNSGQQLHCLAGHSKRVLWLSCSADQKQLVSASCDGSIKTWDLSTFQELRTYQGHQDAVTSVAFSHDGKQLVSGSLDSTIKLWDVASGEELLTLESHVGAVYSVQFGGDSDTVVSAGSAKTIQVWKLQSKDSKSQHGTSPELLSRHTLAVNSLAVSSDGRWLFSGSSDRSICVWSMADQSLVKRVRCKVGVHGITTSPDEHQVVSVGGLRDPIRVWPLAALLDASSDPLTADDSRALTQETGGFSLAEFSPNGRWVAAIKFGSVVEVWDKVRR